MFSTFALRNYANFTICNRKYISTTLIVFVKACAPQIREPLLTRRTSKPPPWLVSQVEAPSAGVHILLVHPLKLSRLGVKCSALQALQLEREARA